MSSRKQQDPYELMVVTHSLPFSGLFNKKRKDKKKKKYGIVARSSDAESMYTSASSTPPSTTSSVSTSSTISEARSFSNCGVPRQYRHQSQSSASAASVRSASTSSTATSATSWYSVADQSHRPPPPPSAAVAAQEKQGSNSRIKFKRPAYSSHDNDGHNSDNDDLVSWFDVEENDEEEDVADIMQRSMALRSPPASKQVSRRPSQQDVVVAIRS